MILGFRLQVLSFVSQESRVWVFFTISDKLVGFECFRVVLTVQRGM